MVAKQVAGKLLDAGGWAMGAEGYRHKHGQTLAGSYLTSKASARKQAQAFAKADWQAIGAKVKALRIIHREVLNDLPVMYPYSQAGIGCAISTLHNYDPADPIGGPGDSWNIWDWYLSATP